MFDRPEDETYMKLALEQAQQAARLGEVPVGAVVVRQGKVISAAHNLREQNHIATAHAELLAIEEACRVLGDWRLEDCTFMSPWSPAPCAPEPSSTAACSVWYTVRPTPVPAAAAVWRIFSTCPLTMRRC